MNGQQNQGADRKQPDQRSFKELLRAYAERSSIKCLPRLMHAKSPLHKVLWFLTFITGGSVASYLLSGLISTYISYEKTLSVTAEEGAKPPFPDVTVCNLNPLWNNGPNWGFLASVAGQDRLLTYDEYIYLLFQNLNRLGYDDSSVDITLPELYSIAGYWKHTKHDQSQLDEMAKMFIWKCIWQTESDQKDCVVSATFTPTNGLCYTIRPPPGEGVSVKTRQEGLSLILYLNNINLRFVADYRLSPFRSYTEGAKILLHPRGTVPQMVEGFTVSPGSEASVVVKYYKRKLLPHPYGACQKEVHLDSENIKGADTLWNYTEFACRSLCYQNKIIEECNCLDSTELVYDELTEQYRYCSMFDLNNMDRTLAEVNCTRTVKEVLDRDNVCPSQCPTPCDKDVFQTSINQVTWPQEVYILGFYYTYVMSRPPSEDFSYYYETAINYVMQTNMSEAWNLVRSTELIQKNFLQLSITMDDTIAYEEDKQAITIETIFGSLGGILNLWIGFTFITIMEFVDLFLTALLERWSNSKVNAESKKTHAKKKVKPQITMVEPFRL